MKPLEYLTKFDYLVGQKEGYILQCILTIPVRVRPVLEQVSLTPSMDWIGYRAGTNTRASLKRELSTSMMQEVPTFHIGG